MLIDIGKRCSDGKSIEEAIEFYNSIFKVVDKDKDKEVDEWAKAHFFLGEAYYELAVLTQDIECLNEAKKYYRSVTELSENPWLVDAWKGIGESNLILGERQRDSNGKRDINKLTESINAFKLSLNMFNESQNPQSWEYNQYKLGRAFQSLGIADSDCLALKESVAAYSAALDCAKTYELLTGHLKRIPSAKMFALKHLF